VLKARILLKADEPPAAVAEAFWLASVSGKTKMAVRVRSLIFNFSLDRPIITLVARWQGDNESYGVLPVRQKVPYYDSIPVMLHLGGANSHDARETNAVERAA
jgi:hypothetical protein